MRHKTLTTAIVLVAALLLAAVLNPSPQRHRERIQEAVGERSPVAKVFGVGALKAFASNYHSLGVASYTKAGDKTLSFGVFGLVFVLN